MGCDGGFHKKVVLISEVKEGNFSMGDRIVNKIESFQ